MIEHQDTNQILLIGSLFKNYYQIMFQMLQKFIFKVLIVILQKQITLLLDAEEDSKNLKFDIRVGANLFCVSGNIC